MRDNYINRFFGFLHELSVSDSLFLKIALLGLFASLIWFFAVLSTGARVETASSGGVLTEGIVGTPRFVNPVLAASRTDRDLVALVFDGLMGLSTDGVLSPNIAESVTVSEDGLTYNVVLRKDVIFHDGTSLTAQDVIFTVGRIQDAALTSPFRPNFDGIVMEQIDDYEFNFVLPEPYAPFIETLTFGILPKNLWKDVSDEEFPFSQYNSEPIGAGPYMISKITRNSSGIPDSYVLKPHKNYHKGGPKIETLTLQFFANEDKLLEAFKKGSVDSMVGIDQAQLSTLEINPLTHTIIRMPLPRTFALFINQNKSPALRDGVVRKALTVALDRNLLIETVLGGYGTPITTPIPSGFGVDVPENTESTTSTTGEDRMETARAMLRNAGWALNETTGIWEKNIDKELTPLSFSIATVNSSTFEATAEFLRTTWEKLGASVTVKQFEQSDLTQSVIRPRDYESLLFGTQVGRSLDFYSFWHSSQRNDPGLNVSLYANITTDSILSESRTSTNNDIRNAALLRFAEEIEKENPAIFLYTPELIYIFPTRIIGATFAGVAEPYERFSSIHNWYINTESVWPFFRKN